MQLLQLLLIAATLSTNALFAQGETITLDQITVATKTQKSIDGVAATVEVINQEEIERIGAVSLKDIMKRIPGLNVQYGTVAGASSKSRSTISIRGMSANGTLILLDGRRLAGETQNSFDLERIPAAIIERIEVVKGPMSSLYGADAVGGVINIVTKTPTDKLRIDAGARFGMSEDSQGENLNLNLSLQGKNGGFGYSAYGTFTTRNPYTQRESEYVWVQQGQANRVAPSAHPNAGIRNIEDRYSEDVTYREESEVLTLGTRLTYAFNSELSMGLDLNYFSEEREGVYIGYFHPSNYMNGESKIPVFNVPVHSRDENERVDISVDATYALSEELELKAKAYRSYYEKRNTTSAREWEAMGYTSQSASAQNGMDANVNLQVTELSALYMPHEAHLLTLGGEYREEQREASVFAQGNTLTGKKMTYRSAYMQDEWQASEALSLILGARYDTISTAENKSTFRIGGVYEFDPMAKLRFNFAQGYRVPDIREMYIHKQTPNGLQIGADIIGYNLKPESTNAYEIGLGGHHEKLHYDIVLFYNDVSNMIAQVTGTYNGKAAYTFENVADAYTGGLELSLKYDFTPNLKGSLYYTELQTENRETDKALEFQPERTVLLGLDYKPTPDLNLGVFAKYIGEQYYTDTLSRGSNSEMTQEKTADGFALLDLRADYTMSEKVTLYGGINNITDERVDNMIGSNMGRYYFVGARMHF
ncbi:TonB-dependent receptor [Sulfurovum sp.]|uniref:TonB-dependent receptor plug domain-containing protein n=1 Tax=Sulfurovum sp. TaxID=1969726 RepID=UPI002A369FD4|nr:TonB-dependent receptor [Sulfurovum sp.]MDY0403305.1 TonB-dependent receptor [Sulfurovum sp.]